MPKQRHRDVAAQPHDRLIKFAFLEREHAAGLLKAALPPEIADQVRWSTLKAEQIQFVDRRLRGRYADIIFSMQLGAERAYAHVLIEHQRKVEPLMIFRMGAYMWRHWERLVRDDPARTTLPAIIPILIHHSETGWTAATAFEDIIAVPEEARAATRPYVPRFEMKLVDVSRDAASGLVDEALTALGRFVLWCLSVAGDRARLLGEVGRKAEDLNALYAGPGARDVLVALIEYIMATHQGMSAATVGELLENTAKTGRKEVGVDVLEELRKEYSREARKEGRREGGANLLLGQLASRFGAVPEEVRMRVLAADERTLSRWSLRLLTAPTLDAVFTARKPPAKKAAPARHPPARKRATAGR